ASFFFASRRRHTRLVSDWSSDVCSSDLRCPFACRGRATRSASNFCNIRNRCCAISARTQARKQRQRERHEMDSGEVTKLGGALRSEERRVGKEGRAREAAYADNRKK